MINKTKFGGLLGSAGVVYGIFYAMRRNKDFLNTAVYSVGFGLVGLFIGNAITKWSEFDGNDKP